MYPLRAPLVLFVGVVLIQACGFHLSGKIPIAPELSVIHVTGTDRDIVKDLEKALRFSGATIADDPSTAKAVLNLFDIDYRRDVGTTDSRGRATSYKLSYLVRYRVVGAGDQVLVNDSTVSSNRNLYFNSTQVLQKEDEENFLRKDMRRNAVLRIMRKLASIQ